MADIDTSQEMTIADGLVIKWLMWSISKNKT